jgi:hypothetical protein
MTPGAVLVAGIPSAVGAPQAFARVGGHDRQRSSIWVRPADQAVLFLMIALHTRYARHFDRE